MKKLTKAEVKFESPGMGKDKCSGCVHFRPMLQPVRACAIVEGVVYPRDWCDRFKARDVIAERSTRRM